MVNVIFKERDGNRRQVGGQAGDSLLDLAHANSIDIEGTCEGQMACSTCHVIVDPDWFDRLDPPSDDEEDMLDLAIGLTATSRLGCQVVLRDELDGLVVELPASVVNMMGL